ncbi:entericidin A/B family lipoprotein [Alteromonas gilva]|uniref:Entericidin A/B family lipoprotein n=1 Tax=Alteromonas gilva TaxID=2987522 RepID=A0ABT5L134_9ALTE|nr:entericidin A/B family lipoprotein [Alteromonas gilva]MDC8830742.1 entericidin A/B family lipoprotein [Alteromonas gilva]
MLLISTFATLSILGGCATVEGLGEDVQSAGEGIEDAAQDASN